MKKKPYKISLNELAERASTYEIAKMLHMNQSSIMAALKKNRDIQITVKPDGTATAVEIKPFPNRKWKKEMNK